MSTSSVKDAALNRFRQFGSRDRASSDESKAYVLTEQEFEHAVRPLEEALVAASAERRELQSMVTDTLWMAYRYADGRRSYAVSLYNAARDRALRRLPWLDSTRAVDGDSPECLGLIERAEAAEALAAERQFLAAQWQPIATAPKGEYLLVGYAGQSRSIMGGRHILRHCGDLEFYDEYGHRYKRPDGWMTLPAAPDFTAEHQVCGEDMGGIEPGVLQCRLPRGHKGDCSAPTVKSEAPL